MATEICSPHAHLHPRGYEENEISITMNDTINNMRSSPVIRRHTTCLKYCFCHALHLSLRSFPAFFVATGRMIDDLFRISWELGVIVILGVVDVGAFPSRLILIDKFVSFTLSYLSSKDKRSTVQHFQSSLRERRSLLHYQMERHFFQS